MSDARARDLPRSGLVQEALYDNAPMYGNGLPGRAPDSGADLPLPRSRARAKGSYTIAYKVETKDDDEFLVVRLARQ